MIYVAATQFRDIVAREGVVVDEAALSDAVLLYPDDTRICRHVADVRRWNAHKKECVEKLVIDNATRARLQNFRYSAGSTNGDEFFEDWPRGHIGDTFWWL